MENILNSKYLTTRKEHECIGCCRKFPVGSKMMRTTYATDHYIESFYLCNTCCIIAGNYPNDSFCKGDFKQEALELEQNNKIV